jgi:GrpB-like predicted nucleotidyltransferase (UPF0157 family)
MADEPLKTTLIGGVEERGIKIVDYDPDWPKKFETHAKIIADALVPALKRHLRVQGT